MRIAIVSSGSGSKGGGEIYLRFLAEGLWKVGHQVVALIPDKPVMDDLASSLEPFASIERITYIPTYDRRLRTAGALLDRGQRKRLAFFMKRLPVDIIHVNQQVAEDGVDLVLAAKESGKAWVSTIHVGYSARALGAQFGRVRDWITERTLRNSHGDFIAVSAASRDKLRERLSSKVHVALNGVPVPQASALEQSRSRARADWATEEDEIVIGTVGRIEPQKAPLALIDHVARLDNGKRKLRLVWIGDGTMRRAVLDHAEQQARQIPFIVDGWRDDASLRLAGLDLFVLPSVFEGLPLALLEAMHAGLPIVASRADGIAEALRHGETGFLCDDLHVWRETLSALLKDSILRSRIGAAAKKDAIERFSTASMAAQTEIVYNEILKQRGFLD